MVSKIWRSICGACSNPNEPQTSQETSNWAELPFLVIVNIFTMLNKTDRRNASAVCKKWRETYFYPRLWRSVHFSIQPDDIQRARFLTYAFGLTVTYAKIALYSVSRECLHEFIGLLNELSCNSNLKTLIIDPSHVGINMTLVDSSADRSFVMAEVMDRLKVCLLKLEEFSICCLEDLPLSIGPILENLNPSLVTKLRLGCEKDNPRKRQEVVRFDPALLRRFTKLEVLSMSYDHLSDELLDALKFAKNLKKFVIHYLGVHGTPPVIAKSAWNQFQKQHDECDLCLTIRYHHGDLLLLESTILGHMPLTRVKAYHIVNMRTNVYEDHPVATELIIRRQ